MNNNSIFEIDLEDYRVKTKNVISKVFTGRDRGRYVREHSKLDENFMNHDTVKIVIPDDIMSINPSFFEELFVNAIIKLGDVGFMKKFKFISNGDYNYERPLQEAVQRVIRTKTALD
jgi:hypothetical protein